MTTPPTIQNQRTEQVAIDKLQPHPQNPRLGDDAATIESIQHTGFIGYIVAQRSTRRILAGHTRLRAARMLGMEKVPVVWVDLDDEAALRFLLADNRTSDLATYDTATLDEVLELLAATPDGLAGTGYAAQRDDDDPEGPFEDPAPSVPEKALKKWKVKPGDVWQAGDQRIVCGDATDRPTYALVLGDEQASMVWTDPPYGVAYEGGTGLTIENDDLDEDALATLLDGAFEFAAEATRSGGAWYVASPGGDLHHLFIEALRTRSMLRQTIIWVKDAFVLGRQDYHWRHEPILYGWKPGEAHYFAPGDRTQDTV